MTKMIDISEAQAHLPELLSFALKGDEIIISKDDKPVAKLVPLPSTPKSRVPGLNKGEIWISDDFDSPLPEEFWTVGQ